MKYNKKDINWLMDKAESNSDRYMEAEDMIIEVMDMSWHERLFCGKKLLNFLKSRGKFNI